MSLARRMMHSSGTMMAAQIIVLCSNLARNVILARMLAPEQFGVAATYAVVMAFLESAFEFGPDKYILQATEGGRAEVVGAAHTFTVMRGLLAGILLFVLAGPIAEIFHVPELAWAYRALAFAPVVKGFLNFDFRVAQRDLSFGSEAIILIASSFVGLAAAFLAALIEPTHVAMLASVLAQVTTLVVISYWLAKSPYRLGFGKAQLGALFHFGWPLVANSMLIVLAMQGDRALVGAALGPEVLAVYATAAILASVPQLVVARVIGIMMLPVLGSLRGQPLFQSRYELFGAAIAIAVLTMNVPIGLLGALAIPIVFGESYQPDPFVVAALAAAGGIGLFRTWTNFAALAVGNSKATLATNLVRTSGLAIAVVALSVGGGLRSVGAALIFGEVAALIFALYRTHRLNNLSVSTGSGFIVPIAASILTTVPLASIVHGFGWESAILSVIAMQLLSFLGLTIFSSSVRSLLKSTVKNLKHV